MLSLWRQKKQTRDRLERDLQSVAPNLTTVYFGPTMPRSDPIKHSATAASKNSETVSLMNAQVARKLSTENTKYV